MSVAALVNVLIFPTVLAFSGEVAHDSSPGWWSLLLLLDVVLWTDVLARFATPLWDDGMLVYDHQRVAVSYLRGSPRGALGSVGRRRWCRLKDCAKICPTRSLTHYGAPPARLIP